MVHFLDLTQVFQPSTFEEDAEDWISRLDQDDVAVECDFAHPKRGNFKWGGGALGYYRREVSSIPLMNREEEQAFCMGLEFLWRRLQAARQKSGFSPAEITRFPGIGDLNCLTCPPGQERICQGCAPVDLADSYRRRLRARTHEFTAVRNELMERNLSLVFLLLERYRYSGVPVEDLVQEANYSLFKAVQGFDFNRGVRFRTYAAFWVKQAFLTAIYNQSRTVRVPAYIQKAMKKLHDAGVALPGAADDLNSLADKAGITENLARTALAGNRFTLSLDRPAGIQEEDSFASLVPGEDPCRPFFEEEAEGFVALLGAALEGLSDREKEVLLLRFGLKGERSKTLAEVGNILGVSLERVRQIQSKALFRLRSCGTAGFLEQYIS